MKFIKLALVLGLITLALAASATYVIAHRGPSGYYGSVEDYVSAPDGEGWWEEMKEHMRYRWGDAVDEEWFAEMRAYMEERFEEVRSQEWFEEMEQFMDERWDSKEYGYRFGGYDGYGRFGRFGGCHW